MEQLRGPSGKQNNAIEYTVWLSPKQGSSVGTSLREGWVGP